MELCNRCVPINDSECDQLTHRVRVSGQWLTVTAHSQNVDTRHVVLSIDIDTCGLVYA